MSKINWARLTLGALIAAAICFISDGFLHQRLVDGQWEAVFAALQLDITEHEHGSAMIYFVIFELGRGFLTLFVYSLMRPRFGAGPLTAVWAGVVAWFAYSLTGPVQFIPLGFFSNELWLAAGGYQLVASVIAAVAGAAPYKE